MTTFANYCHTCDHQQVVDDFSSGDSVCVDCGLVLDKIYLHHSNIIKNETHLSHNSLDIIERMCAKCNIENENIKNVITKKWQDLKKIWRKNVCTESLAMVCIYIGLIESKSPRPLSHLCEQTNVNIKNVWQYLKANDSFYKPNLMCEYFLHTLNLSFKDIEEIRKMVKRYESMYVFSQKTLIASCAYIFLRGRENTSNKHTSVTQLAKQLGISSMAIYRCVKKLNNKEL